jgi:hypothetical protein
MYQPIFAIIAIKTTLNIAVPEYRDEDIWSIGDLIDDQRIHFYLSESAKKFSG